MPADIPGFFFDSEKNRYFRVLPGQSTGRAASGSHASSSRGRGGGRGHAGADSPQAERVAGAQRKKQRVIAAKPGGCQLNDSKSNIASLVRLREMVNSSGVGSRGWGQRTFQRAVMEVETGHAQIWEYQASSCTVPTDKALLQLCTYAQTSEGMKELSVLLSGDSIGCVSVWKPTTHVAADGFDEWVLHPQLLGTKAQPQPATANDPGVPPLLDGRHPLSCGLLESSIAGISPLHTGSCELPHPVVAVTTMGGSSSGGIVRLLTFLEDEAGASYSFSGFEKTVWASTSSPSGPFLALAASKGATLLTYQDGRGLVINRQLCKSNSDVLAVEFDNEGKTLLCGFRNGAVSTIDLRKPSPKMYSSGPSDDPRRTPAAGQSHRGGKLAQRRAVYGRNMKRIIDPMYCSHAPVMMMPSSITSIRMLPSDNNYVIAAAMDGSLWRWDRRFTRSAVLRYEGHVNSHTFLPCTIDPSESLLMAGGEDSAMRIWSVSSGQLLRSIPNLNGPITAVASLAVPERRPSRALSQSPSGWDEWWGRPASSGWDNWWAQRTHPWALWLGCEDTLMYMCGAASATPPQL